ncbi:TrkA family potassium uptake protein [Carnobacteriaceae bacterium zg-ZUI252]|nr:TrkA family potassium uptake protein [Carnobacteriaceae bacterium zg-ZUI252]MBS4770326.1 TrkA family potassium uptake protein [Carnobacteriaceae bacterium zg-ZUI240]QTU82385.1 TrkA family potassium uptake protein [Carnobacteriaceae bacterium zg-C25]
MKNIAVLGLGIFGRTIAKELSQFECDVLAIDMNEQLVEEISEYVLKTAVGDMTQLDFLEAAGVGECDVAIIATGTRLESSVLSVMHCKTLGVKQIIAKAKNESFASVLQALGVNQVITPEKKAGQQLAHQLLKNKIKEMIALDEHMTIVEFQAPTKWIGKSIIDLDIRQKYGVNLIGIKDSSGKINAKLDIHHIIEQDTSFVGIAETQLFLETDFLGEL